MFVVRLDGAGEGLRERKEKGNPSEEGKPYTAAMEEERVRGERRGLDASRRGRGELGGGGLGGGTLGGTPGGGEPGRGELGRGELGRGTLAGGGVLGGRLGSIG